MSQPIDPAPSIGEPFPLKRQFRRRFAPALLVFFALSLLIIGLTAREAVEAIYLELAQRRAQTIERSVRENGGEAWQALMSGRSIAQLRESDDAAGLAQAFETEVERQQLPELKVYDLNRVVLYATHAEEIGTREAGEALREAISEAQPGLVTRTLPSGEKQYEFYVPVYDDDGVLRAVFELYEPVRYLDDIYITSAIPIIAVLVLLFVVLGVALDRLVIRAQRDIDARSNLIGALRQRLESLVSATAADAARAAAGGNEMASRKLTTTLFFSDIRDFTGFSEHHSPEDVVGFLNAVMGLQVDILARHGGDVDKMIGDAILARFDAADGAARAVAAAREIQARVSQAQMPRRIGIGIFRGEVISGAIGPETRRDFTVIGDAVNIAARLCTAAQAGEIVVEASLADAQFGAPETVTVKGREAPLQIRRQTIDATAA
ncbi:MULTISPECIES: adenylate/guanylate cyclase domain-containing protein [unclassified Minwuia]|uniref:adenylate/guanylate cyclase domain-containing protein n=1 Tax=unclassified Minwuia TaxID=2618799 RepID=UPI00247871F1|nr:MULTISPECIES: adenylate/guanylate cyclase domain-containing protein [unclassified Minwuia]